MENATNNVLLLSSTYLFLAPAITLGVKYVLVNLHFHFPMFTILVLLMMEWCLAALTQTQTTPLVSGNLYPASSVDSWSFNTPRLLAVLIGIFLAAEIGCGNVGLLTLDVSFYTMVKASTPAFVLVFSILAGLEKASIGIFCIIGIIVLGVTLCFLGEINFELSGFVFVVASCVAGGLRWVATQIYLKSQASPTPVELIYQSLPSAVLTLAMFCVIFEIRPMLDFLSASDDYLLIKLSMFAISFAGSAFIMHPGVAAFDETDGAIERSRTEDLGQTALILLGRVGVADQEATQLIS